MPSKRRSQPIDGDAAKRIVQRALELSTGGDTAAAFKTAKPLLDAASELVPADALAFLLLRGAFEREQALVAANAILARDGDDIGVLSKLGGACPDLADVRYLNAAPPEEPVVVEIAKRLKGLLDTRAFADEKEELSLVRALASAARMSGRDWDRVSEDCARRAIELEPENWDHHYGLGLFLKTRGRFREGQTANQRALDLGGKDDEATQWNLGICATGAGDGSTARAVWQTIGQDIPLGRFGLPDSDKFHQVKVRVAEFPKAERSEADSEWPDEPGMEETIWIERLSPCHGIVRSALYQELGVDFGDVILFDGAPITFQEYDGKQIPVFPHLSTLVHSNYRIVPFGGRQARAQQIGDLTEQLPLDAVLYCHSERTQLLCSHCWELGRGSQTAHDPKQHRVVTGKLCAPPEISAQELLAILDRAVSQAEGVELLVPELVADAGDLERAAVEARRLGMIVNS